MTRSVFDPTGPDTEQSGSRNLGPAASNISHMPADVTDGRVDEEQEPSPDADADTEPDEGTSGADEGVSPWSPEAYEPDPEGPTTSTED